MFARTYCVTLDRRPDRWTEFQAALPQPLPFPAPVRYAAIDGKICKPPAWWRQGAPAWGCYRSHLNIIESCLNEGVESVMIFEDDATFCPDFNDKLTELKASLPNDWDMLYLGGQLLFARDKGNEPLRLNDWCYQPYNVNRTHAYAVNGKFLSTLYKHLNATDVWRSGHHIDHHYGRLHQQRKYNVIIPPYWLVGQNESHSDIKGQEMPTRFWLDATTYEKDVVHPFVLVVGLHASGSSCLATCLHKLGVHMGNSFAYRPDSGEAKGLAKICEDMMPFPRVDCAKSQEWLTRELVKWAKGRSAEAHQKGGIAGAKYPHLCALSKPLEDYFGDKLRVIHIDRPLGDSIASLQKREPHRKPESIEALQRYLHDEKSKMLARHPDHLTINYYDLLASPAEELQRATEWLGIRPSGHQISQAAFHVDRNKQHVGPKEELQEAG
jgi:hypothetical protein